MCGMRKIGDHGGRESGTVPPKGGERIREKICAMRERGNRAKFAAGDNIYTYIYVLYVYTTYIYI